MLNNFNKYLNMEIIGSIINILIGIIFIMNPNESLKVLSIIVSVILIIYGGFCIIGSLKSNFIFYYMGMTMGLISLISGIVIFINDGIFEIVVPIFLGIYFILSGIFKIKLSIYLKEINESYILLLIFSILTIIVGMLMILRPITSAILLTTFIGGLMILYAVINIVDILIIKKQGKQIKKYLSNIIS